MAPSDDSSLTSAAIFRLMRPSVITTGLNSTCDAECLPLDRDLSAPAAVGDDGNRELAAGMELGGLAGDGGEVGLRQRADQPGALQRLHHRRDRVVPGLVQVPCSAAPAIDMRRHSRRMAMPAARSRPVTGNAFCITLAKEMLPEFRTAPGHIDPEPPDGVALHLRHLHPEQHLLLGGDAEHVDDAVLLLGVAGGDIVGTVGVDRD